MSSALLIPLLFLGGLLAGSFGGMAVNRLPDPTLKIFSPRPRCIHCQQSIATRDMIPILSWVLLRAKCRKCGDRITWAYPLLELIVAVLFAVAGLRFGASWTLVPVLVLFWMLTVASTTDLYIYRIPNRLTFPTLGVVLAMVVALHFIDPDAGNLRSAIIGMLTYFGLLAVLWFIYPKGMGLGDVKLALVMGLVVGWIADTAAEGLVLITWALLLGSILGAVMGLVTAALRKRGIDPLPDEIGQKIAEERAVEKAAKKAEKAGLDVDTAVAEAEAKPVVNKFFPFGPGLAAGCIAVVLFAEQILPAAN
ncbi:MAG: prepilin peptidase [Acidimicrobiales bacterium]|nr:prepilin peptidase [Acidimicrobiales bacterium]